MSNGTQSAIGKITGGGLYSKPPSQQQSKPSDKPPSPPRSIAPTTPSAIGKITSSPSRSSGGGGSSRGSSSRSTPSSTVVKDVLEQKPQTVIPQPVERRSIIQKIPQVRQQEQLVRVDVTDDVGNIVGTSTRVQRSTFSRMAQIQPDARQDTVPARRILTDEELREVRRGQQLRQDVEFLTPSQKQSRLAAGAQAAGRRAGSVVSNVITGRDFFGNPLVSEGTKAGTVPLIGGIRGGLRLAPRALSFLRTQPTTRLGIFSRQVTIGIPSNFVSGLAAERTTREVFRLWAPKQQREFIRSPQLQQVFKQAQQARKEVVEQQGRIRQTGFGISTVFAGKQAQQAFEKTLRDQARALNLGEDREKAFIQAGLRERRGQAIGEIIGLLSVSTSSELVGKAGVRQAFKLAKGNIIDRGKTFGALFKESFPGIGAATLSEGISAEAVQSISRGESITAKNLAIAGGIGFGAGSLLGATRAGLIIDRPTAGKLLGGALLISDPLELPGDIIASASEGVARRLGRSIPEPQIRARGKGFELGVSNTPSRSRVNLPTVKVPESRIIDPRQTRIRVLSPRIPDVRLVDTPRIPSPRFREPRIPTIRIPSTRIGTPKITDPRIPEPRVTTPRIFSPRVPVITPLLRIPPPLPLDLNLAGNISASQKAGKTRFVNELSAGSSLFRGIIGGGIPQRVRAPSKRTSKKKKR